MENHRLGKLLLPLTVVLVEFVPLLAVFAQDVHVQTDARRWIIESVGRAAASPELIYLMMKFEYEGAQAADATSRGEKQLTEFLAAVDGLKIPGLTYHVHTNVITPAQGDGGVLSGFVYTRNVVFDLPPPRSDMSRGELDQIIAKLEDLGARYNSHCVTCIGSG